jgi:hypothetical protein
MSFKEGDIVTVTTKNSIHEGKNGTVVGIYEDDQTYRVSIEQPAPKGSGFESMGVLSGFFESELALVDPKQEALIRLAETLDSARLQANNINGCEGTIYQQITIPLIGVLDALVPVDAVGYAAYEFIIEDGLSVREALKKVEK